MLIIIIIIIIIIMSLKWVGGDYLVVGNFFYLRRIAWEKTAFLYNALFLGSASEILHRWLFKFRIKPFFRIYFVRNSFNLPFLLQINLTSEIDCT